MNINVEEIKKFDDKEENNLKQGEIEISAEISAEDMEEFRQKAIEELGKNMEIEGFRKGNAPNDVVASKAGEDEVLQKTADMAIKSAYPKIIEEKNIDPIGQPQVTVKKLAVENPLVFSIRTSTMPEVKVGDYKKAAEKVEKKEEETEVPDQEVEDVIKEAQKRMAAQQKAEQTTDSKEEENENEEQQAKDSDQQQEEQKENEDENLPELNDEFAKKLGDFENLDQLRSQIKDNLKKEKEMKAKDKVRMEILENLAQDSEVEVPEVLIEAETEKMMNKLKDDLSRAGLSFEDYLKKIDKEEEKVKEEMRGESEKRSRFGLIINKISKDEQITPTEEEINSELEKLLSQYQDADKDQARNYVVNNLINEKTLTFLENQIEK